MKPISDILQELEGLSPTLAAIPRRNVFTVPDGYFNQFSDNVLTLIQPDQNLSIPLQEPAKWSVPEGYFDGLADSIMSRIKGEENESAMDEIRKLSPAISAIGNSNVFQVPEAYFESLGFLVSQRIPQPAKVIELPKRKSIVRYMAAAVITGLIGISVFSIFNNRTAADMMAAPDAAVMAEASKIISTNSFEKELASISDKDIESFLAENGQDVNAALVASVTDDATVLPGSEEYLLNENTLDEFLHQMNLNN